MYIKNRGQQMDSCCFYVMRAVILVIGHVFVAFLVSLWRYKPPWLGCCKCIHMLRASSVSRALNRARDQQMPLCLGCRLLPAVLLQVRLRAEDVIICETRIDQGMKSQNPMDRVNFYQTRDADAGDKHFPITVQEVTNMFGTVFQVGLVTCCTFCAAVVAVVLTPSSPLYILKTQ